MAVHQRTSTALFCILAFFCPLPRLSAQLSPAAQKAAETKVVDPKVQAAKAAAIQQQYVKNPAAGAAQTSVSKPTLPPLQITLTPIPAVPYAGQPLRVVVTPNHPTSTATYFFQWEDHTEDTASREPQAPHTYASAGVYHVTVHVRASVNGTAQPAEAALTLVVKQQPPVETPKKSGSIPTTTQPSPAPKPNPVIPKISQVIPKFNQPPLKIILASYPDAPYAGQTDRITVTPSYPTSNARYLFEWGDHTPATPSNEPQASHVFANPGSYNVIVLVRALANDNDVAARNTLTVVVNPPPPPPPKLEPSPPPPPDQTTPAPTQTTPTPVPNPTLTLAASQTHALPGQPITFTVASDPPTGFTEFQYQFGDTDPPGIPGPGIPGPNNVQHFYTKPGTYYASASTLSADGQTTITSNEVQLRVDPAPLPELLLTLITPNPVAKGSTVVDASLDPRQPDESYRFDWGDTTPADTVDSLGRGSHIYAKPGTYILSVVGITPAGNIPGQKNIVIVAPPPWKFPVYPTLVAILIAGVLAYWAYHHFNSKVPVGELHSTFGVNRATASNIKIPDAAPYVSLTFTNGAEAPDHRITFL